MRPLSFFTPPSAAVGHVSSMQVILTHLLPPSPAGGSRDSVELQEAALPVSAAGRAYKHFADASCSGVPPVRGVSISLHAPTTTRHTHPHNTHYQSSYSSFPSSPASPAGLPFSSASFNVTQLQQSSSSFTALTPHKNAATPSEAPLEKP